MHIGVALRAGKPAASRKAQMQERSALLRRVGNRASGGITGIGKRGKRMLSWHSVALPSVAPIVNPSRAASLLQGVLNALGQEKQRCARRSARCGLLGQQFSLLATNDGSRPSLLQNRTGLVQM